MAENDPHLTVAKMRVRRVCAGVYEYRNAATGTEWRIARYDDYGRPGWHEWAVVGASAPGERPVYLELQPSKADAMIALCDYLRHRYRSSQGWVAG